MNRFVSKHRSKDSTLRVRGTIVSGLELTIPVGIITGTLLFMFAPFISTVLLKTPEVAPLLRILAVTIPIHVFLDGIMDVFQAFQRMDYYAGIQLLFRSAALVLLSLLLILSGYGVIGVAAAYAITIVATAGLGFYSLQTHVFSVIGGSAPRNHRTILAFSLPLLGVKIGGMVNMHIPNFLLAWFVNTTPTDIGVYNAALPTAQILNVFGHIFAVILFPVITAHLARQEHETAMQIMGTTVRWSVAIALPITLFMMLFSGEILHTIFGQEYIAGRMILIMAAGAVFIRVAVEPVKAYLLAEDETVLLMVNSLVMVGSTVLLSYMLIPTYGVIGAGAAISGSLIINAILIAGEGLFLFSAGLPVRGISASVIAGGAAAAVTHPLLQSLPLTPEWELLIGLPVFGSIYGVIFLWSGGVRKEDELVLQTLDQRIDADLTVLKKAFRKIS